MNALTLVMDGPSEREIHYYYFTLAEVADMIKCSENCLRKYLGQGEFGEVIYRGEWRIPPDGVQRLREQIWKH